jgi:tRNA modification GTPase
VIELAGIEKSLEKMQQADVILYIFDINEMESAELTERVKEFEKLNKQYVLAGNKADIATIDVAEKFGAAQKIFSISAKNKIGIESIQTALFDSTVGESPVTENVVVTNARHYSALQQVSQSLDDIKKGLDSGSATDLVALDIRRCLHFISEITGDISNEDVLDFIFSKFCIGK